MWRRLKWIAGGLVLVLTSGAIWGVIELRRTDHFMLLVLTHSTIQPVSWVMEQGLRWLHPTPEEVQEFNREAGAITIIVDSQEPRARRLLAHYIAAGLDINRPDLRSPLLWTPLHSVTQYDESRYMRMLLDAGARIAVRDAKGRTPLDLARKYQKEFPNSPEAAEKLRLMEAAEQAQSHANSASPAASAPAQK